MTLGAIRVSSQFIPCLASYYIFRGTMSDVFHPRLSPMKVILLIGVLIEEVRLSTQHTLVPTIGPTFGNRFQAICSESNLDEEACLSLLLSATMENRMLTADLSHKNEALIDAADRAVTDWNFAVSDVTRLEPLVEDFVAGGRPPMQTIVKRLQSNVSDLSTAIQPKFSSLNNVSRNLSDASDADMLVLTQQVELAAQEALQRVVAAADLSQTTPSKYATNITKSLQEYWDSEFPNIKALVAADQDRIGGQVSASQSILSSITSFFHDQLNGLRLDSANLTNYMANNSVINRITQSQNSLQQSLKSFSDELLATTLSQSYARLLPQLAASSAAANSNLSDHFNTSLDQLGEAIDANITSAINMANEGEHQATQEYQSIDHSFRDQISAYSDLLNAAAYAVGLVTNKSSQNVSNPYLISDKDLGPDSLVDFNGNKMSLESQLNVLTDAIPTEESKAKAELSQFADSQSLDLNQTIAALTMLVGSLAQPNMSSGIDPVYLNWTQYAAGLEETTLPGILEQFKLMIANVSDWVFKSEFLDKVSSGSHAVDPDIGSLMTGNYRFINQTRRKSMDQYVEGQKAAIQAWVSGELAEIQSTIKQEEKGKVLDAMRDQYSGDLETRSKVVAEKIEDERDDADTATTELALGLVEGPAAQYSSILTDKETRLKAELVEMHSMDTAIKRALKQLVDSDRSIETSAKNFASQIDDRDTKLETSIAGVLGDMSQGISDYSSNFENTLPSSLAVDVNGLGKQLENAEKFVVDTQSDSMTRAINKKIDQNKMYKQTIASAGKEVIDRGRGVLETLKNTKDIDYDSLFPNSFAVIDEDEIQAKAVSAAHAQAAIAESAMNQKSGELVQAVQAQTGLSATRDSQLKGAESDLAARLAAESTTKISLSDRVKTASDSARGLLGNTNETIKALATTSREKMHSLSSSVASQSRDLLFHVTDSAPDFLSTFESEQIEKLMSKLNLINSTVNDINQEAVGQFGNFDSGSFLDQTVPTPKPSKAIASLMSLLRKDRQSEHRLEDETWGVLKSLNASVRAHDQRQVVSVKGENQTENEFVDALTRVVNETEKSENQTHDYVGKVVRAQVVFDKVEEGFVERNTSNIRNLVGVAHQVLNSLNTTERAEIVEAISSLSSRVSNLRGIVDKFSNLSSWTISPNAQKVKDELQRPLVAVTVSKPEGNSNLENAKKLVISHVNETQSVLTNRIQSESDSFNHTLDSIGSIFATLETITESEDKLEDDFQDKIIAKFHKRNDKYEKEFEAEYSQVKDEMDHTVASFESKQDMQKELHDLIRRLRRERIDKLK